MAASAQKSPRRSRFLRDVDELFTVELEEVEPETRRVVHGILAPTLHVAAERAHGHEHGRLALRNRLRHAREPFREGRTLELLEGRERRVDERRAAVVGADERLAVRAIATRPHATPIITYLIFISSSSLSSPQTTKPKNRS